MQCGDEDAEAVSYSLQEGVEDVSSSIIRPEIYLRYSSIKLQCILHVFMNQTIMIEFRTPVFNSVAGTYQSKMNHKRS